MLNRFIVVDDFYNDPDTFVKIALSTMKEEDSPTGNYAGVMTTQSFLSEQHREIFQKLTLENSINSSTNANGRIRFTRANDTFKFHIHYDVDVQTRWAGVVYLSKEHPKVDGTSFWRHLRTGLEIAPTHRKVLRGTAGEISTISRHFWKPRVLMNPCGKNLHHPIQVQSPGLVQTMAAALSWPGVW